MVDGSIAVLKVAVKAVAMATPFAPLRGVVAITVGLTLVIGVPGEAVVKVQT